RQPPRAENPAPGSNLTVPVVGPPNCFSSTFSMKFPRKSPPIYQPGARMSVGSPGTTPVDGRISAAELWLAATSNIPRKQIERVCVFMRVCALFIPISEIPGQFECPDSIRHPNQHGNTERPHRTQEK